MLEPIKLNNKKVVLLGDKHEGHNKKFLWEARGFNNIEEHDKFINDALWTQAQKEPTILINLGDNCLGKDQEENFERLSLIPFEEHYSIPGNHCAGMRQCYKRAIKGLNLPKESKEVYPLKFNHITFVGEILRTYINKQPVVFSHMAQYVWDLYGEGAWQLCAHSHGQLSEANFSDSILGKSFDCGVDNALKYTNRARPFFCWEEIRDIMKNKTVKIHDHHGGNS